MNSPDIVLLATPAFVTSTSCAPEGMTEVVQVRETLELDPMKQELPPTCTVGFMKLEPEIVTVVPPITDPEFGEMLRSEGGGTAVKAFVRVLAAPPLLVTTTSFSPIERAGVEQTTEEAFTELTGQLDPPIVTVGETKPVPEMVTTAPPRVEPLGGSMDESEGGAITVKAPERVPDTPVEFVTTTSLDPAVRLGVEHTTEEALHEETEQVLPPIVTVGDEILEPEIVTVFPPVGEPTLGEIPLREGGS